MHPIIEVKGLWKEYQRGAQKEQYLSLRNQLFKNLKPQKKKEAFWALEDINFKVEQGDSLAIIGRNGAGKSTLLKILSKITPPTKGEITLRGRLAALLEVGTGFHPELTGRENIYLNGSILGLERKEINRQFDAIVDFSGVESSLDTPLKHYSSGMQLRLAFSVAAHLEPEILVVDEVLAVGDSTFQQKCIEKMMEVTQSGRTVLFVSHNIQAIKNLCNTGILLKEGLFDYSGSIDDTINHYLNQGEIIDTNSTVINCKFLERKNSIKNIEVIELKFNKRRFAPYDSFVVQLKLSEQTNEKFNEMFISVNVRDNLGQSIYHLSNVFKNILVNHVDGNIYELSMDQMKLKPGIYEIGYFIRANEEIQDWVPSATHIEILDGNIYGYSNSDVISGIIQPNFEFNIR